MKIAHDGLKAGKRNYSSALSLDRYVQGLKKGRKKVGEKVNSDESGKNLVFIKHIFKSHRPCLSLMYKTT
jgi:hypothetical protein